MPGGFVQDAMAPGLSVPTMRSQHMQRDPEPKGLPVPWLPLSGLGDPGDHLRQHQAAAATLVFGHLSGHPGEGRHLFAEPGPNHRHIRQRRPAHET